MKHRRNGRAKDMEKKRKERVPKGRMKKKKKERNVNEEKAKRNTTWSEN